jgi:hypothetical protein
VRIWFGQSRVGARAELLAFCQQFGVNFHADDDFIFAHKKDLRL